ncbi:hypothetical protein MGYG_07885 [Nannizzia gypsea CBS 118893]|uniref:Uncharacterized protein n=1 Tax=Arthroderma gypseum (strain ATCC MYA-4604 / CBS 118893) TaxID=535722 RepID=E4V4G0_ARTGP|nr:hypothetical protein MGYG_07885 [Nannizzia gypsea CBS 118893]EFR04884.1 hypothetical protein MGYG_07885 [Nannizzia gypsea CBS 118893]
MESGLSTAQEGALERQLRSLEAIHALLTVEQAAQILRKLLRGCTQNRQVMWSGVPYQIAQQWAKEHGMQTLSIAMGSLMEKNDPSCLKSKMSPKRWSKYMKGASAIFAYYISQGATVIVLTPPPPFKFHPSGRTNYQAIEEPILKGAFGDAVSQIQMVHPTVKGAEHSSYQAWPLDKTCVWIANFGDTLAMKEPHWRSVCARAIISIRITTGENVITAGPSAGQDTDVGDSGLGLNKGSRSAIHLVGNEQT